MTDPDQFAPDPTHLLELDAPRWPTPATDPNGLAAGATFAVGAVLTALGATDVIAAKWTTAATALLAVAAMLWARLKAWPPAKVWLEAMAARSRGQAQGAAMAHEQLLELAAARPLKATPAAKPAPKRAKRTTPPRRSSS